MLLPIALAAFAAVAADVWPDGTEIAPWFLETSPVDVAKLGKAYRFNENYIFPELNGDSPIWLYKGATLVGYRVLYSPTPDFKNATTLGTSDGTFDGDVATWSTVWEGKFDAPTGTGFYKVEAIK